MQNATLKMKKRSPFIENDRKPMQAMAQNVLSYWTFNRNRLRKYKNKCVS